MEVKRARPLLGTIVTIAVDGLSVSDANRVIDLGFAEVAEVHELMSFQLRSSDVSRLNREAALHPVLVHPKTVAVVRRSLEVSAASNGLFDVSVAGALVAKGVLPQPDSSQHPDRFGSWRDIEVLDSRKIQFHRPLWIDLSGIAKGYAVDRAIKRTAVDATVASCVNAGGDLRVSGPVQERIALSLTPISCSESATLVLNNQSLATSCSRGNKARGCDHSAHLNGRSREPVGFGRAATVVAQNCTIADALTKVVITAGEDSRGTLMKFEATAFFYERDVGWKTIGEIGDSCGSDATPR